jgi:serine/threonine-protein kinase
MKRRDLAGSFATLDALLRETLERDPAGRAACLSRIDAEDPRLARRLRGMLAAADCEAGTDPIAAALCAPLWTALADDPAAGQRFGAWRAMGTLAHGGMARVLLAERVDGAYEQVAAIKCLWPGIASPQLVARFEQERQILARLDEPRIARLLDGGIRDDGLPWLALEYVAGAPITTHCDALQCGLEERLDLWSDVALAVAAAHRQLVVHRDLKPANVLVSREGAVKLLDFGIAKLLDAEGFPHAAPPTQWHGQALTRAWASPEQLRGEPVTTASDVYQLGLLLYELACGFAPAAAATQAGGSRDGLERPAPSQAMRKGGAAAEALARQRATSARRLARRLHGEFDAIIAHALAPSPADRYASADALREDVERWRGGLPVRASRIGATRRIAKWLARHRALALATAVLLLLGAAYAATTLQQARAIARQAEVNRGVRDYLVGWFQAADPGSDAGRDPRASEMLAQGLARARRDLAPQPALEAEILGIIGEVYMARGEYAQAEPPLREALALHSALPAPAPRYRGAAATSLGTLLHYTGRYDEAEALLRSALRERLEALGPGALFTILTRQQLADVLHSRGRYDAAIAGFRQALDAARLLRGERDPLVATLQRGLADVLRDNGAPGPATALYARALASQVAAHGELHPNTVATRMQWGRLLLDAGRYEEAARQIEPAFAAYSRMWPASAPSSVYWERLVAELDEARGDLAGAGARLHRLVEAMRGSLPPTHLIHGYLALDAGNLALAQGCAGEAHTQFTRAAGVFEAIQPRGHPRGSEALLGLALAARLSGDRAGATRALAEAERQAHRLLPDGHPFLAALAAAKGQGRVPQGLAGLRVQRALAAEAAVARGLPPSGASLP